MTRGFRRMNSRRRSSSLSLGGFPQIPGPANQVSPVSVAGHGRNVWHLESVSRHHVGRGSTLKRPCGRCDNRNTCICNCSDEERTNFICSPDLLHFKCALWPHTSKAWLASDSFALVSLVSATYVPEGAVPCPKRWRTASISVKKETQWREDDYESYEIRSGMLTPYERIQNLCSFFSTNWAAQRHQLMSGGVHWSNCRITWKIVWAIQWNEWHTKNQT